MKVVKIEWRDSSRYDDQGANDYAWEVSIFESVGFLLRKEKDFVVIARDIILNESRGALVIPRENITKITFLR